MRNYMNTYHVAKTLGVNIQTVRHYIRKGELRAARVGKRYVITQEDIDRFLEGRKEARDLERIGLTEQGQDMVFKMRENSKRVLAYLKQCPGAGAEEIGKALGVGPEEVERALRRLEEGDLVHCEPGEGTPDRLRDPWYAGSSKAG